MSDSSPLYTSDSSDYVSSIVTDKTPFPSLTKSQRLKLNEILHKDFNSNDEVQVSTFEIKPVNEPADEENKENKNSCCCLC